MPLPEVCAQWREVQVPIWAAAFHAFGADVVPITPPDGRIGEGSTLKPEAMGKAPGIYAPGTDSWTGFPKWQQVQATKELVAQWSRWPGCNIGLHTRNMIAADVDVDDPAAVAVIRRVLVAQLGEPVWRVRSNSARCAGLYAMEHGDFPMIGKRVFKLAYKPTNIVIGKVEWLTKGQQLVIAGVHPSGAQLGLTYHGDMVLVS
jgi:hypothetical protein